MENIVNTLSQYVGPAIASLIGALVVLLVGWILAAIAARVVSAIATRLQVDKRIAGAHQCQGEYCYSRFDGQAKRPILEGEKLVGG